MEKTVLPLLMRENEAAARLAVAPRTLQAWRCRGGGPAFVRIAGAIRYAEDDLEAFVRAGRTAPTARTFR
jgi:predicted site-specific integrase-resolvase